MNRRFSLIFGLAAAAGLIVLILDSKTALQGAQEGVMLCIQTMIPSLFPFLFLSNLLSASMIGRRLLFLRPLGRLCRIPEGAEYILISGLLGGYPVGACCISEAYESGVLSGQNARRMLAFCNNCGPAFLFGMSAALFDQWWIPWVLLTIHIGSALLVGVIVPGKAGIFAAEIKSQISPVRSLNQAVRGMAGICGWVVIFKTMIVFLERWFLWYFPTEIQVAVGGLLELSNGCIGLNRVQSTQLRFIMCVGFLSFGGLCVTMQTFFSSGRVDKGLYFPGKVLQCCISLTIASLLCGWHTWIIPAMVGTLLSIFLRKEQKICRNLQPVDV